MAEFRPLRALRYDGARVGDMAAVVAPPYDVIAESVVARLYARSPHNVVRLILNRAANGHAAAACELESWRATGILVQDAAPAFYFYRQSFEVPRRGRLVRDGVMGIMRLERFDSGRVLPHERTLSAPKEDRLRLLRACRANLDPIFGLVSRPGLRLETLAGAALAAAPLLDFGDEMGVHHQLWRVADAGSIEQLAGAVRDEPVLIADGHHRYETALNFREEMRRAYPDAGPQAPFEFVLAYLANSEEPGLVVLPTHRILTTARPEQVRDAIGALTDLFTVTAYPHARRDAFVAAVETGVGEIGCVLPEELLLLAPREIASARLAAHSPATRCLAVVLLHELVLPRMTATIGEGLAFTHDEAEVFAALDGGGVGFLVHAPSAAEVRAVCLAGETLPQKSTYFYPKLLTGLVFHSLVP